MSQKKLTPSARKSLGEEIGKMAPTAVLVRILPSRRGSIYLFEEHFYRIFLDRKTEEEVARRVRRFFGGLADWRLAHDFYLPANELYLTPEPHQKGYIPEDDQSFGLVPARRIAISNGKFE
ncbi:hypothetical protein ACFWIA_08110 [Streptomyces sp. NPDC127068]|uniref:hypothetical protein n=1 Tax=Streptomyces sp. NPDC127068 TaxID=3347127 RepID=UPI0036540B14